MSIDKCRGYHIITLLYHRSTELQVFWGDRVVVYNTTIMLLMAIVFAFRLCYTESNEEHKSGLRYNNNKLYNEKGSTMTQATTTQATIEDVTKGGDWVIPVTRKDGSTVYALQINKSKEDKENIDAIVAEYTQAGVTILRYKGKEDKDVLLVDATQKIRSKRVGVKTQKLLDALLATGMTQEQAQAVITASK